MKAVIRFTNPRSGINFDGWAGIARSEDIISHAICSIVRTTNHIRAMLCAINERIVENIGGLPRPFVAESNPDLTVNYQIAVACNVGGIKNQYPKSGSCIG
jgi:hypothetical protein